MGAGMKVMRNPFRGGAALAAMLAFSPLAAAKDMRPNILLILADDLGYSDLGAFGGEIDTPNLDRLAQRGMRLTSFYTASACAPSRAMLLTGVDNHQAGVGTMIEALPLTPSLVGRPGYEGRLNFRVATIAERLRAVGYSTMMAGKWHLGKGEGERPAERGFDQSYALLGGAHNHYGADQIEAYRKIGAEPEYHADGKPVRYPVGEYSSDYFTTRLMGMLKHEGAPSQKPFFAYLAFTAPHWPLQAPDADIRKYRGKYDDGPVALRERRLARMKQLGVLPQGAIAEAAMADWNGLSDADRAEAARRMEVYAAMVDRMDRNVGRILDKLGASGQLDNTIVIFLSDNGPESHAFNRAINYTNPRQAVAFPVDNSLANMGRANSFIAYGRDWALAASAPYRGVKSDITDGGIHSPVIVAGPGVAAGGTSSALTHAIDIVPTLLAAAGADSNNGGGRQNILPPQGRSLLELLQGGSASARSDNAPLFWELFFRRAVRKGSLKAVYQPALFAAGGNANSEWTLYDLAVDPGETRDLASERPEKIAELVRLWMSYAREKGVIIEPPTAPNPAR
jgi:arylsulfatase